MLYHISIWVCVTINILSQEQHEYTMSVLRANTLFYNKSVVSYFTMRGNKFNRTHIGISTQMTFKEDLKNNFVAHFQAYKFLSNEYRLFPLTLSKDVCRVLETNEFGLANILNFGNLTKCPIKKGNYVIDNWMPDYYKLPPHLPIGDFKIHLLYTKDTYAIMEDEIFLEIKAIDLL